MTFLLLPSTWLLKAYSKADEQGVLQCLQGGKEGHSMVASLNRRSVKYGQLCTLGHGMAHCRTKYMQTTLYDKFFSTRGFANRFPNQSQP